MINAIIFDGEGVVFDSEMIWDRGQQDFLQRRGVAYERDKLKPLLTGRSLVEGVRVMQSLYGFTGQPETLARERLKIVQFLFATEVSFLTGFLEFHAKVKALHRTCLATSLAMELLELVDRRLGLSALFSDHVFSIADVGNIGKPAPDVFLFAARQLHTPAEHCLVIEDAPLGIEAARRAGMPCVALTSTYGREQLGAADAVVDRFSEIDLGKF